MTRQYRQIEGWSPPSESPEPSYIAQTGIEGWSSDECRAWILRCRDEAGAEGVTHARVTEGYPGHPDLLLFEGWLERPEHEGEARFQLQAVEQGAT